jgi:hypothetical protein
MPLLGKFINSPEFEDEETEALTSIAGDDGSDQQLDDIPQQFQNLKITGYHKIDDEQQPEEDKNFQGLVRNIPGARLLFKKQMDDGTFEELWIYVIVPGLHSEVKIRKKILAGTDIPQRQTHSPNGEQSYKVWTAGDRQYLHITGLPN